MLKIVARIAVILMVVAVSTSCGKRGKLVPEREVFGDSN